MINQMFQIILIITASKLVILMKAYKLFEESSFWPLIIIYYPAAILK